MIRNILKASLLCAVLFSLACSTSSSRLALDYNNDTSLSYLDSGVISIARALPSTTNLDRDSSVQIPALGFIPVQFDQYWLEADTSTNSLKLMRGNTAVKTVQTSQLDLRDGHFKVSLLEQNALWHANDKYFLDRNLPLPLEFSPERYLKGALGEYSIHLDNGQVIHSSLIEDKGIDGIRVAANDLKDIFSVLEADSKIIVK